MDITTCIHPGCGLEFFLVPERTHPELCIDHEADASRFERGWTPQNSAN